MVVWLISDARFTLIIRDQFHSNSFMSCNSVTKTLAVSRL